MPTTTTQKQARADARAAYNRGYQDALNARAPEAPGDFYYMIGHDEGWPKRMVMTYVMTSRGPVSERCTLERAAFLLSTNARIPGGRR